MWAEFKAFMLRGNVIDLAVAVVMATAFTNIVNSIVADLITPLIGLILGGINFNEANFAVGNAVFTVGNLIMAIINFVIVGTVLFLVVKAMNTLMKKQAAAPAPPPGPTEDQKLLGEIRDLLRERPRL